MTRAKTPAQFRREVPAYDLAVRAVEALRRASRIPHVVAHIHPDTLVVSIVLHGTRAHTATADRLLHDFAIPAGDWQPETVHGVDIWRKRVQS